MKILEKIGLQTTTTNEFKDETSFPMDKFIRYYFWHQKTVPEQELDDLNGTTDEWVVHKQTGLRIQFLCKDIGPRHSANYKVIRIFIRTTEDRCEYNIKDINTESKYFITENGKMIPFSKTDSEI